MTIDGKHVAAQVKTRIRNGLLGMPHRPKLAIVIAKRSLAIDKFVALKKGFGEDVGIDVDVLHLDALADTEKLLQTVLHQSFTHDGVIVQLPLARGMVLEPLLKIIPLTHDVDVIGDTATTQYRLWNLPIHPPVVGAIDEILLQSGMRLAGRKVLVVGEGRLVGKPVALYAEHFGAHVTVANAYTPNITELTKENEVIILGAGSPELLKPDMIQEGAIILDAGTSEQGGVLKGDADPACAEKAALFTPTPGGIGPVTVAKVFENLLKLYQLRHSDDVKI